MAVILIEPSRAIRLPIAVHAALGDALRPCAEITAEGLGKDAASLQPLPARGR